MNSATLHPLHYATLPSRQNARRAFARRVRAICGLLVSAVLLGVLSGLLTFAVVSSGARIALYLLSR